MQRLAIFVIVIMPLGAHGFPAPKETQPTPPDLLVGVWQLKSRDGKAITKQEVIAFMTDGRGQVILNAGVGVTVYCKYSFDDHKLKIDCDGSHDIFEVKVLASKKLILLDDKGSQLDLRRLD